MHFLVAETLAAMGIYWSILLWPKFFPLSLAALVLGIFVLHLFLFRDIESAGPVLMGSLSSLIYVPVLLAFVPLIREENNGLNFIFFLMLVTWAGDSGAYLAGRLLGRHKLYQAVSPKKTIEGMLGGVAAAILVAFLARGTFFSDLSILECLLLAPLVDLAGVLGDLAESLLKRSAGIKDSGKIFPGHGGILDRIDSLLFSAPVLYGYILLTG